MHENDRRATNVARVIGYSAAESAHPGHPSGGEGIRQLHRGSGGKNVPFEDVVSVGEDLVEFAAHEQIAYECTSGNRIDDGILDMRTVSLGTEAMLVNPKPIGATSLLVDESVGWLPRGDLALPVNRDTVEPKSLLDSCADLHLDRQGAHDLESQPGRGDPFQVLRRREESKHFVEWTIEGLVPFQLEGAHSGSGISNDSALALSFA